MSGFMKTALGVVISILLSFSSMSFFLPKNMGGADGAALTAAFMSDTHITGELYRRLIFTPGVKDVSRRVKPDLFVVTGDCTDNGNDKNWSAFASVLEKHLTTENRLIAMGNHDTWTSYDTPHDYGEAKENYLRYANAVMGTSYEDVWFTYEINGYTFIVTGSEDTSVGATISDAQLSWLEQTLAAAAEPGKPIFVISHQPLSFSHSVGEDDDDGFKDVAASRRMQEILDRYENVFLFSGHLHYGLNDGKLDYPAGYTTVERIGSHITSVNLPSYEYGSFGLGGSAWIGQGLVMRVYADRVELLGRNFALGQWVNAVQVTVPLV